MTPTVLLVPGYLNSAPGHWQSLWEEEHPEFRRVMQRDWEAPDRQEWIQTLDQAIYTSAAPVVLAGHSCGSVAIALWGEQWRGRWGEQHNSCPVIGALLVAPADCEAADAIPAIQPLAPMPRTPLPFPSIVVASSNDPYIRLPRAQAFAQAWGSRLQVLQGAGHITTDSGYGDWAEGKQWLQELMNGK
ncbi:alpha/beta hydrolase [Oscillatoria sp. FACHB-1407]|uniref:RBBP9/YdeN family alpha/beta hydrolase n=1 Tax=Oscillatoria sp. FACHB-1407 TaxID=2692847 RepID=UPI0016868CE9|nr:alpha/beta hydrolase [Oscillatoria sp. FACHB-1407]MBD2460098.1 alpha/beta hydrolase [Oscillatoria sp. FACHB-1407]